MAEAFIVRRGGGGSGGTLVVTSSGAGTVTVSNTTLGKSYSKTVTAGGSVTFKALKTGTWTVTLSNGTQTATRSVTINADYSVSVAYFSATISITYPANSTCVVTNSGGQTVASDSNRGSSAKTWTATVNSTGTYTITATSTSDSSKTKSTTVSITKDGQSKSVALLFEFVLYKTGNEYTDITGGWYASDKHLSPTLSKNENNMTITLPTGSDIAVAPKSAINLTAYSTLKIRFSKLAYKSNGYQYWGLSQSATGFTIDTYSAVAKLETAVNNVVSCDIAEVTSAQFAKLVISGLNDGEGTITTVIEKIWAE